MQRMNIFEALRQSHTVQRHLSALLLKTHGDTVERHTLFQALKGELAVHALAEDRHFYIPLMQHDAGIDLSRHAIAEHHQIDELVEALETTAASSPAWLPLARKLTEKVEHHLREEEQRFFQMAGKLLTDAQKSALARDYLNEYDTAKAELVQRTHRTDAYALGATLRLHSRRGGPWSPGKITIKNIAACADKSGARGPFL